MILVLLLLHTAAASAPVEAVSTDPLRVSLPSFLLNGLEWNALVTVPAQLTSWTGNLTIAYRVSLDDVLVRSGIVSNITQAGLSFEIPLIVNAVRSVLVFDFQFISGSSISVYQYEHPFASMPPWLTLLPPIGAIAGVIILKEAFFGLYVGLFLSCFLLRSYNPVQGFLDSISIYFVGAWSSLANAEVLVFAIFLSGWTALIKQSGGFTALTTLLARKVPVSSRAVALSAIFLGLIIQLSSHASIFLVGSSMLELCDLARVSRDKLAFILDATASPVASLSIISSFAAVQISYIAQEFSALEYGLLSPFLAFVQSIPQGFYQVNIIALCILTTVFQRELFFMVAPECEVKKAMDDGSVSERDDEPLVVKISSAESDSRSNRSISDVSVSLTLSEKKGYAINALLPFLFLIAVTITGIFVIGYFADEGIASPTLVEILGRSNAVQALLWGISASLLLLFAMLLVQRRKFADLVETFYFGCSEILPAMLMLLMAWALSESIQLLQLGRFVGLGLSRGLPSGMLPGLVFLMCVVISFASGTSFGTSE